MRTFSTLLMVFSCQLVFAQATTVSLSTDLEFTTTNNLKSTPSDDWTLYADQENKLFYIDFEKLQVNVSDVVIKNEEGEVLLKDNVFNLPVNTIYELDFSKYQSGRYEIELRTFTGSIRKRILIE